MNYNDEIYAKKFARYYTDFKPVAKTLKTEAICYFQKCGGWLM